MARKSNFARVENAKVVGTSVLSFKLVLNKEKRFFAVGCYFPPSDKEGKAQWLVEQALRDKPVGTMPLAIGEHQLGRSTEPTRGGSGAEHGGLRPRVHHGRHLRGRLTWRQIKENATRLDNHRWIHSRPDAILIPKAERKRVKSCRRISPPSTTALTTAS